MTVHNFHCGGEWTDFTFFGANHPQAGTTVYIPYLAFLLQWDERVLLFDTGPNAELVRNPAAWIGESAELYDVRVDESQLLVNQLHALGVSPSEITDVVLSHLHYDHAGSVKSFPNATVHVQRTEYDSAIGAYGEGAADYVRSEFDGKLNWNFLDGGTDLFGDGRCIILATPGHTPGHQSLVANSEAGPVIFVGDAAPHPQTLATRVLPSVVWDAASEVASWRHLEDSAARYQATLVFPHDPNFRDTMYLVPGGSAAR